MELNAIFNNYPTLVKIKINMFFNLKCKIEGLGLLNFMTWTQTSIFWLTLKKDQTMELTFCQIWNQRFENKLWK
jgi:hypothetical protein